MGKSFTETTQADADAQSVGYQGVAAKDDGIALGGYYNKNVAPGALLADALGVIGGQGGSGNKNLASGALDFSNSRDSVANVTIGLDSDGVLALTNSHEQTVKALLDAQKDSASDYAKIIEGQTDATGDLAESKLTDGVSSVGKIFLGAVALIVIGVVAWGFSQFKKRT